MLPPEASSCPKLRLFVPSLAVRPVDLAEILGFGVLCISRVSRVSLVFALVYLVCKLFTLLFTLCTLSLLRAVGTAACGRCSSLSPWSFINRASIRSGSTPSPVTFLVSMRRGWGRSSASLPLSLLPRFPRRALVCSGSSGGAALFLLGGRSCTLRSTRRRGDRNLHSGSSLCHMPGSLAELGEALEEALRAALGAAVGAGVGSEGWIAHYHGPFYCSAGWGT